MAEQNAGFDDIDLDITAEAELARLASMQDDDDDVTPDRSNDAPLETENQEPEDEAEAATTADGDEGSSTTDEPEAAPVESEAEQKTDPLKELQEERERLQSILKQMEDTSKADRQRLDALEQELKAAREAPPPGEPEDVDDSPTPEQILAHLDGRIVALDTALVKAQQDNPADVPAIRQSIRQLERYYNSFVAQQQLAAIEQPDPDAVVQRAVKETNQRNRFAAARDMIVNEFPMLDSKGDVFNADLRDQIHRVYNPMLAAGADPVQALIEATQLVTRANGISSVSQRVAARNAEEEAKAKAELEAKERAVKEEKKRQTATERTRSAVEKNVDAAKATPPNLASVGNAGVTSNILDKYDFDKMTVTDMMSLTPEQEAQIEKALAMYGS